MSSAVVKSPLGGDSCLVRAVAVDEVEELYLRKCNVSIKGFLKGVDELYLYECLLTGLYFWYPRHVSGSAEFYAQLERNWPGYYREERWEYAVAERYLTPGDRLLEVGAGRGFFLNRIEGRIFETVGLDSNLSAIENKLCRSIISSESFEQFVTGRHGGSSFNCICSFQVLEHLVDLDAFFSSVSSLLDTGGRLMFSVPNFDNASLRAGGEAFDMPPHHMNHFTEESVLKIAGLYGFTVKSVHFQPRHAELPPVSPKNKQSFVSRLGHYFLRRCLKLLYRITAEPGDTMLVVAVKEL